MGALLLPTGRIGLGRPVAQGKALGDSSFSDVPLVDGDPHFIIHVPGKNDTICFNIDEKPGTVLRLIQDPVTGRCAYRLGFSLSGSEGPGEFMDRVLLTLPGKHPSSCAEHSA